MSYNDVSLLCAVFFLGFVALSIICFVYEFKYNSLRRKYVATHITREEAELILCIFHSSYFGDKDLKDFSPDTMSLYLKFLDVVRYYDKEKNM